MSWRRNGLRVRRASFVVLLLGGGALAELAAGLAQAAGQAGQLGPAEQHEDDDQHDQQLGCANASHESSLRDNPDDAVLPPEHARPLDRLALTEERAEQDLDRQRPPYRCTM